MVGGAHLQYNQIPHLPGGWPTNWKMIMSQMFSYRSESCFFVSYFIFLNKKNFFGHTAWFPNQGLKLCPLHWKHGVLTTWPPLEIPGWEFWVICLAPQSRVWHQEEKPPKHLALKASRAWLQECHRTGGSRNTTLGGCTQGLVHTWTQGKKQWLHRSLGQTCLLVLESLLGRQGVAVAHCRDDTGAKGTGEYSLVWAVLEAAILMPRLGPTQQTLGSSAGMPQAK